MTPVSSATFGITGGQSVSPKVRLADAAGIPLAGLAVTFAATGGTVSPATATTGADGTASTTWTPDAYSGEQTITASLDRFSQQFTAEVTTSLAGTWSGSSGSMSVTITIQHAINSNGTITGTGRVNFGGGAATSVTVTGTSTGPQFAVGLYFQQINGTQGLVSFAGGWSEKDPRALKTSYQQVDEATLLAVVSEPTKLREVKPDAETA
jgi:hypothetical protein